MLDDFTGRMADAATYPPDVAYLPGRSVTDGEASGVVVDVHGLDVVTVRWEGTFTQRCAVTELRAVHPDRPVLSRDEELVVFLGEALARRDGALDRFRDGCNNGYIAYKEAARGVLRDWDGRQTLRRCRHTYVVDPDGLRRGDPKAFDAGDRLVTCAFFADGPGRIMCGAHADDRGSIYQPTPDDMAIPPDCMAIRDVVALSPYETAGPMRIAAAA